jgi:hypothetical protein
MSFQNESGGYFAAADVRRAAQGQWVSVLGAFGVRTELLRPRHGPCPGCGGRDRFRFDDLAGTGSFLCSQGGGEVLAGDGISLLAHCLNIQWKEAVQKLGHHLGLKSQGGGHRREAGPAVAPAPEARENKRPEVDEAALWEFTHGVPDIDREFFSRRSKVDVRGVDPASFLESLYRHGERVLIFTDWRSQGDFLYEAGGRGGFRLSAQRGVRAVPSALPGGGENGVWFLVQPVTGTWEVNQKHLQGSAEPAKWTRRSEVNVTAWRYLVLENDTIPEADWLKVLANLPFPLAALYTSGRRSVHALVKWEMGSKPEWDRLRDIVRRLLCPLGADPGALSAVRLSRLPGCRRGKGMQELIYLNPNPESVEVRMLREERA